MECVNIRAVVSPKILNGMMRHNNIFTENGILKVAYLSGDDTLNKHELDGN